MKHDDPDPSLPQKTEPDSKEMLMEEAHRAAENHQPDRMLEALAISGFLDGLVRQLDKRWDRMDRMDIEDCVARAVDEAYDAITKKRKISNLRAWLWKATYNKLNDLWRKQYSLRVTNDHTGIEGLASNCESSETEEERQRRDEIAQNRRAEAIRLARSLLPKIGKGQVVSVMELMIDAVEHDVPDMSPADIGDTLGITADAARTLIGRGFKRLHRAARDAGITLPEDVTDADL